jgi:hypothetical protein
MAASNFIQQHKLVLQDIYLARTYALRSPNPLRKGALDVPPFLRGARGDRGFRLECVSPTCIAQPIQTEWHKRAIRSLIPRGGRDFPNFNIYWECRIPRLRGLQPGLLQEEISGCDRCTTNR